MVRCLDKFCPCDRNTVNFLCVCIYKDIQHALYHYNCINNKKYLVFKSVFTNNCTCHSVNYIQKTITDHLRRQTNMDTEEYFDVLETAHIHIKQIIQWFIHSFIWTTLFFLSRLLVSLFTLKWFAEVPNINKCK